MASIFTKIVKGDIPSYKIGETENCYAFLDINPLAKGHTLVIPKKEEDYLFDVDDKTYGELMQFAKKVAGAIGQSVPCKRVGVAVLGLEIPHAHVHLIPIHSEADINFSNPKLKLSEEEFQRIAQQIREKL
jgi:histidine triad (HIT) family protein